jgi:hypothetical protein
MIYSTIVFLVVLALLLWISYLKSLEILGTKFEFDTYKKTQKIEK